MTTTSSATEIWLIGNSKSDNDTSYLLTTGDACAPFFTFSKIKMPQQMML